MLYALGLGYGSDPLDPTQIDFVFEETLKIVPSMVNVIAHPGFWIKAPELGIDWVKVLHAEQAFEIHRPLRTTGRMRGEYRIVSVEDKGPEKGAILTMEKALVDCETEERSATVTQVVFMRGDGGQGGFGTPSHISAPLPDKPPERVVDIPTMPQIALVYRLSGDYNPIHAHPEVARKAGFDRPILHGLCTMGLATRAVVETYCKGYPERLTSMSVRFAKPVYPGETIRTEFFEVGEEIRFRCRVVERDLIVLDRGAAKITEG